MTKNIGGGAVHSLLGQQLRNQGRMEANQNLKPRPGNQLTASSSKIKKRAGEKRLVGTGLPPTRRDRNNSRTRRRADRQIEEGDRDQKIRPNWRQGQATNPEGPGSRSAGVKRGGMAVVCGPPMGAGERLKNTARKGSKKKLVNPDNKERS